MSQESFLCYFQSTEKFMIVEWTLFSEIKEWFKTLNFSVDFSIDIYIAEM